MKRLLGLLVIIASFGFGWLWMTYDHEISRALVDDQAVRLEIRQGDSLNRVSRRLTELGLMRSPYWFTILAIVEGKSGNIQAGEYRLVAGTTARDVLDLIVTGRVRQYPLTLVEGRSFRQMLAEICNNPAIKKTVCSQDYTLIMEQLGLPGEHPEGRFYPDTYFLVRGTTDLNFLRRAKRQMDQVLQQEWKSRAENLPLASPYEALILASIIEKETAKGDERAMIAGVFVRRLRQGMLLQTDPTVIYGMGARYNGNIRSRDLKEPTPYNTYVISGLPPTPIAMPGHASIHAALHPADGSDLYFVARGDGGHVFSETLTEHNRAVDRYQRRKRRQ